MSHDSARSAAFARLATAILGSFVAAAHARAQDLASLRLEAMANSLDVDVAPAWIYTVGAALVFILLWNVATRVREDGEIVGRKPRVQNLYLRLFFGAPGGPKQTGHLLSLKLDAAVLVTTRAFSRGETLELDLGSLPDYPDSCGTVRAAVVSQRQVAGGPDTFVIRVRFLPLEAEGRECLRRYLLGLMDHRIYAHARV